MKKNKYLKLLLLQSLLLVFLSSCLKSQSFNVPAFSKNDPSLIKNGILQLSPAQITLLSFHEELAPVKVVDSIKGEPRTKLGMVNKQGRFKISPKYDSLVSPFFTGIAVVGKKGENQEYFFGAINKKDENVVPFSYKTVAKSEGRTIPVKNFHDLWGFYDIEGNLLHAPAFEAYTILTNSFIKVRKNGKWGILNSTGKFFVEPKFKAIEIDQKGNVHLENFPTFLIKNLKNETLGNIQYSDIIPFGKEIFLYKTEGQFGLVDFSKNSGAHFDSIAFLQGENFLVQKSGKFGLLDPSFKLLIPTEFDSIKVDENGLVFLKSKEDGGWGIMENKALKVPFKYKNFCEVSEGLVAAQSVSNGLWGYLNMEGDTIIPFKFTSATTFQNGLAKVSIIDSCGLEPLVINKKGEIKLRQEDIPAFDAGINRPNRKGEIRYSFSSDKYFAFDSLNKDFVIGRSDKGKGIIMRNGQEFTRTLYDSVFYSQELNGFIIFKDSAVGAILANGQMAILLSKKYDQIFPYSDGYARVKKKGKFGCIDLNKNVRISVQYPFLKDFNDGIAATVINGKWAVINKEEDIIIQPYYDEISNAVNGIVRARAGKKWLLLNRQGKSFSSVGYDSISLLNGGYYKVYLNGKVGLCNSIGKEVMIPKYDNIKELKENFFQVWKDGKTGLINGDGNITVPIDHLNLNFDPLNENFIVKVAQKQEEIVAFPLGKP